MNPPNRTATLRSFFIGGLLPIISFTLIEEYYGVVAGLIAAMIFGVGELSYEYFRYRKVERITLIGNGLIIGLGLISLWSTDGIWFKMQPAIFCAIFAAALFATSIMKKPLLVSLSRAQNPNLPDLAIQFLTSLNWRLGIFFLLQTGIGIWAAIYWSTAAWATLKGIGLPVFMIIYMLLEVLYFRWKNKHLQN